MKLSGEAVSKTGITDDSSNHNLGSYVPINCVLIMNFYTIKNL